MGRPREGKKTGRVYTTLDEPTLTRVQAVARREGVTPAWFVRRAIVEKLERCDRESEPELPLARTRMAGALPAITRREQ
jgi:hypothetical protein